MYLLRYQRVARYQKSVFESLLFLIQSTIYSLWHQKWITLPCWRPQPGRLEWRRLAPCPGLLTWSLSLRAVWSSEMSASPSVRRCTQTSQCRPFALKRRCTALKQMWRLRTSWFQKVFTWTWLTASHRQEPSGRWWRSRCKTAQVRPPYLATYLLLLTKFPLIFPCNTEETLEKMKWILLSCFLGKHLGIILSIVGVVLVIVTAVGIWFFLRWVFCINMF